MQNNVDTQHKQMYSFLFIGSLCNVTLPIARFTCIVTSQVFVEIWMRWSMALSSAFYRGREHLWKVFSFKGHLATFKQRVQEILSEHRLLYRPTDWQVQNNMPFHFKRGIKSIRYVYVYETRFSLLTDSHRKWRFVQNAWHSEEICSRIFKTFEVWETCPCYTKYIWRPGRINCQNLKNHFF